MAVHPLRPDRSGRHRPRPADLRAHPAGHARTRRGPGPGPRLSAGHLRRHLFRAGLQRRVRRAARPGGFRQPSPLRGPGHRGQRRAGPAAGGRAGSVDRRRRPGHRLLPGGLLPGRLKVLLPHPLAGIGMQNNFYGKQKVEVDGVTTELDRSNTTKFAFNLGGGITLPLSERSYLNAEAKFMFANDDNVVIMLGYGYKF